MASPFLGEIRMFAGTFAPRSWALCNGQLLSIAQNTALFSVLGTMYGGDGRTTFALPDLQGTMPVGAGQGPGLTLRAQGERGGEAAVALTTAQIPGHTHGAQASAAPGSQASPQGAVWAAAGGGRGERMYGSSPGAAMSPQALAAAGSGQAHNNIQPYLPVTFIICLQGVYPART